MLLGHSHKTWALEETYIVLTAGIKTSVVCFRTKTVNTRKGEHYKAADFASSKLLPSEMPQISESNPPSHSLLLPLYLFAPADYSFPEMLHYKRKIFIRF